MCHAEWYPLTERHSCWSPQRRLNVTHTAKTTQKKNAKVCLLSLSRPPPPIEIGKMCLYGYGIKSWTPPPLCFLELGTKVWVLMLRLCCTPEGCCLVHTCFNMLCRSMNLTLSHYCHSKKMAILEESMMGAVNMALWPDVNHKIV